VPHEIYEKLISQHNVLDVIRLVELLVRTDSPNHFSHEERQLIRTIIDNAKTLSDKQQDLKETGSEHLIFLLSVFANFTDKFGNLESCVSSPDSSQASRNTNQLLSTSSAASSPCQSTSTSSESIHNSDDCVKTNLVDQQDSQMCDLTDWNDAGESFAYQLNPFTNHQLDYPQFGQFCHFPAQDQVFGMSLFEDNSHVSSSTLSSDDGFECDQTIDDVSTLQFCKDPLYITSLYHMPNSIANFDSCIVFSETTEEEANPNFHLDMLDV